MATKDISTPTKWRTSGELGGADGETPEDTFSRHNTAMDDIETSMQGIQDRLEDTVVEIVGNGRLTGCQLSDGGGLTVDMSAGTALVGYDLGSVSAVTGHSVTASSTNHVWLMQDGTLESNTTGTAPTSQACIKLGTVTTDGSSVTAVDNTATTDTLEILGGLGSGDGISVTLIAEGLVEFDASTGHHHDGTDSTPITGTTSDSFDVGDGTDTDKYIYAANGDANQPGIRYDASANKWQYSNDGSAWNDIATSAGSTPGDTVVAETSYGESSTAGVSAEVSRKDHSHGTPSLSTNTPTSIDAGDTGAAGSGTEPSKSDHEHAVSTAAASGAFGTTAGEGTSTDLARADHVHAAFSATTPSDVASTSSAGSSSKAARVDHAHEGVHSVAKSGESEITGDVVIAAGSNMTITQSGSVITFASTTTGTTAATTVENETSLDVASSVGTGTAFARDDHTHGSPAAATASEIDTGSEDDKVVTPDALAGSIHGTRLIHVSVYDDDTDVATGDGTTFFRVPAEMDGMEIVSVGAGVGTAGTTGTTDIQIRRERGGTAADVLSTKCTIDSGERDSSTAATAAVIDGSNDDLSEADRLYVDVDAVSTTAPQGLSVTIGARLP